MPIDLKQLDELIRKITEEVTSQVLLVITSESSEIKDQSWPDWDEFNHLDYTVESVESNDSVESNESTNHSSLRNRLNGNVDPIIEDDEVELTAGTSAGTVAPLVTSGMDDFRKGGFDPRANPNWFNVQYQRDVVLPSRVAPKGA